MSSPNRIVVHITSSDEADWEMALRNMLNLVQSESVAAQPELMQVVVNGDAVRFLMTSAAEATKVTQMAQGGVTVSACKNSLERFGYEPAALADGVTTVASGVAEVVRAQQRGDTYLKLP